jgi:hypothetical protein
MIGFWCGENALSPRKRQSGGKSYSLTNRDAQTTRTVGMCRENRSASIIFGMSRIEIALISTEDRAFFTIVISLNYMIETLAGYWYCTDRSQEICCRI